VHVVSLHRKKVNRGCVPRVTFFMLGDGWRFYRL
jgi:hypothetical protein